MFYDCGARPILPNAELGLLYPKQCHGETVYVSSTESILWVGLPLLGAAIGISLGVINRRIKTR